MTKNYTSLGLIAAFGLTGCLTSQTQSPIYDQNSAAYSGAGASQYGAQPINASYNGATSYSASGQQAAYQECLRRETNRELIGGAVGGTAGAFAGKELIGGTTGTLAGAAIGGVAGYGIGNLTASCGPDPATRANSTYQTNTAYQSAPRYDATPTAYSSPVSCPGGTTAQPNGTCLLQDNVRRVQTPAARTSQASTFQASTHQTPAYQAYEPQRFETAPRSGSLVRAAAPVAPTSYIGAEETRQFGASAYRVKSGDTVYSLARGLCVPVSDIQGSNGLDSNFGIKIGQTLNLPSNRC